jgi:glycosyltransferase involved in cell wall biosynthesis
MLAKTPSISIVIPALNEAANLRVVLPALPEVHEVILVDGHSVDGTVEVARSVRPGIKVVHQTRRGKGNALACGFAAATGDVIVMFDADGSADPAEIPLFVRALANGADYAKGSRFHGAGPHGGPRCGSADISRLRRLGNAGLNGLANGLFGTRFSDLCYGYNAFWRDILPLLGLPPVSDRGPDAGRLCWGDGFEIETVLSCRVAAAHLRVVEVPSYEHRRIFGETNLRTFADGARVLRTIVVERLGAGRRRGTAGGLTVERDMRTGAALAVAPRRRTNSARLIRRPAAGRAYVPRGRLRFAPGGARSYLSGLWRPAQRHTEGHAQ